MRIEDYALIGDLQTAALVNRFGSIDWCCFPRFDSGACFAALLGDPNNGRWIVAPKTKIERTTRRYRHDTLILESVHTTAEGAVRLIDFMPPRGEAPDIVRIVEGLDGRVPIRSELVIRFDYGRTVPWVRRVDHARVAVAGPDALCFRTEVEVHGEDLRTVAEFEVEAGERIPFVLTWFPSHQEVPDAIDAERALTESEDYWLDWAGKCGHQGDYHEEIHQSLLVLKALTYAPTGGIVAAPTTSLPENLGGVRNWDYRFCWLRDATLTLLAMLNAGYSDEAEAWRGWLLRAVAGDPADLQIMYGLAGERRLDEFELDWLVGFAESKPVRVGNAACKQLQLDVYGEVLDALYQARADGLPPDDNAWAMILKLLEWLEEGWRLETRASGRCAGRRAISRTRRSWPGSPSTGRSGSTRSSTGRARSTAGVRCATRSTPRCSTAAGVRRSSRSRSRTAPTSSTPACSCSRSSGSCRPTTTASSRPSTRSGASSPRTASSSATGSASTRRTTAFPATRASSSPARSGSRRCWRCKATTRRRASSSSGCSTSATTSASSPRSTTRERAGSSATFRRRSRTSRSSTLPSRWAGRAMRR